MDKNKYVLSLLDKLEKKKEDISNEHERKIIRTGHVNDFLNGCEVMLRWMLGEISKDKG
jgi:hypothetical protein